MLWRSRRIYRIVLENVPRSYFSCRQYLCIFLDIIILMVFLSFFSLVSPCKFWFITWHAWGQVLMDLAFTWGWDSLPWLAAVVSPPWSSPSMSGKYFLSRDDVSHGAGWECQFTSVAGGRRCRRLSPKGLAGIAWAGLRNRHIFGFRRCPCCGWFYAKTVLTGLKTIVRIVPSYFVII